MHQNQEGRAACSPTWSAAPAGRPDEGDTDGTTYPQSPIPPGARDKPGPPPQAQELTLSFQRFQFTPDTLVTDLT